MNSDLRPTEFSSPESNGVRGQVLKRESRPKRTPPPISVHFEGEGKVMILTTPETHERYCATAN